MPTRAELETHEASRLASYAMLSRDSRGRRHPEEVGENERAAMWLEIGWSVVPLAIMLAMFAWGTRVFFRLYRPPKDAVEFTAIGKQWMWKIQHPGGQREINMLHVPVVRRAPTYPKLLDAMPEMFPGYGMSVNGAVTDDRGSAYSLFEYEIPGGAEFRTVLYRRESDGSPVPTSTRSPKMVGRVGIWRWLGGRVGGFVYFRGSVATANPANAHHDEEDHADAEEDGLRSRAPVRIRPPE